MGLQSLLRDDKFNYFFSLLLGIGIICMIRPICHGTECTIEKAPTDKDFDKHVYRMAGGKCYEFKTAVAECPSSGTIEAFQDELRPTFESQFRHRGTPIQFT
jgi:hypothetical protein